MTTTPAAPAAELEPAAWRKLENWFFRECNEGTRRHLYAMFDMPLDEIRNHGHERHVLNHIRRKLQSSDQLQALIEERDGLREEVERLRLDVRAQECLQDSAYKAGFKAGWNAGIIQDEDTYTSATRYTDHIEELRKVKAARAALAGEKP